jgi:O-antigen/teichoic acid export membrane protein
MSTAVPKRSVSLSSRAFWLMLAKSVAFCFSFTLPLLLTRRLSQSEYGFYKGAFQFINTVIIFPHVGFGVSAYYFIPREQRPQQGAIVSNVLFLYCTVGVLAALALLLFPHLLIPLIGGEVGPALVSHAPLIGLAILCWVGSSFLEVIAVANQESHIATAFIVNAQLTKTGFLFLAALLFGSIHALLWAAIIQGVVQATVLQFYLRSRFGSYWRNFNRQTLRGQFAYALPMGAAGMLSFAIADMHNYFVLHRFSATDVAVYGVGCFVFPLIGIITDSVSAIMIPHLSRLQKEGSTREIITTTAAAMRKLAAIYFPLCAFLLVMGQEIIVFLFTKKYLASWPVFAVTVMLMPFLIFASDPILRAYAQHRYFMLKVRAALVVVMVFALWWATATLGYVGAIAVMVGIHVLDRLIMTGKACRTLGVTWRDAALLKDLNKIAAAVLLSALVTGLTRLTLLDVRPFFSLLICGIVFSLAYVACFALFGTLSAGERELVNRYAARAAAIFKRKRYGQAL